MYATARFNDQNIANTFQKVLASSGALGLEAGQYFTGEGGTEYRTVTGIDPNQPGWGNRVPPGYELIGYQSPEMYTGRQRQTYGSTPKTPGFAILRKQAPPAPAPAPAPKLAPIAKTPQPSRTPVQEPPKLPAVDPRVAQLEKTISGLKTDYSKSLKSYQAEAAKMAAAQNTRISDLQNLVTSTREQAAEQMRQAQMQFVAQLDRPTTAGVKTATGSSGTPMQIARRGATGAFGRTGMRISSLNI